jgi:parallel beta-helix repeat protein
VKPAAAFMSYVRLDDERDDGKLTQFREKLSAEVHAQTGKKFPIFQDRDDIAWGQNWQQRIDQTLDAVTLLIPIMTPSFFLSLPCRSEVERFLGRERKLGRQDLILPVYYIDAPVFSDPRLREADELAETLASRQFADWRHLRFEPFTSSVVLKELERLARRMRDTFWQQPAAPISRPSSLRPTVTHPARLEATATKTTTTAEPAAKAEPPAPYVVDAFHRGDYATIGAAIKAARPGDRILVRPGLYQEGLVVDKPLEILGDGPAHDIEVQARGANALLFKAKIGRVANLTLRQADVKDDWYGVDITQGRLELEDCDISSQSLSGVAIRSRADPRLRRNRIHDNKQAGVLVYANGLGTLEDNDITANGEAGVEIKTGGNPTVRRNRINRNTCGVHVYERGRGVIEDNDLASNAKGAWNIAKDCEPYMKRSGNRE